MPKEFLLPCSCGKKVRIALAQAGGKATCVCGKRLDVPTMRGIRVLEVAPPDSPATQPLVWTATHGALFSGGLVLAAVGVVLIAFYLFRYAQIGGYAVDRSGDVIQAMSTQIDGVTPSQALEVWQKEILEEGLGEPQTPYWVTAKERVSEYFWWIKFGAGALVLGVLTAIATLLIGRKA
jgi:hypothetical protein